jgi:Protein of unknown function (DUF2600).
MIIFNPFWRKWISAVLIEQEWRVLQISKRSDLQGILLISEYLTKVFPKVEQELIRWTYFAEKIPETPLRQQALASIASKRFHAQGGSVYCLYPTVKDPEGILRFIVAFQTISDYLDNLCDRAGVEDQTAFHQLHLAMLDAVTPEGDLNDYYLYFPYQNDLGYLNLLVAECRTQIGKLRSNPLILNYLRQRVQLYTHLQAFKHMQVPLREPYLSAWAKTYRDLFPQLSWWEFSAASGSTLEIFLLTAAALDPSLTAAEVVAIDQVYFPYVQGLHILLDYYIDTQEDRRTGDLNFVQYYQNRQQCLTRLQFFIEQSLKNCAILSFAKFHRTVIRGMLAMYLSDAKALTAANQFITKSLLKQGGPVTFFYYYCCRLLRKQGRL